MGKILWCLAAAATFVGFLYVAKSDMESRHAQAQQVLGGAHELRRVTAQTETTSSISGGYFLFVGSISGSTTSDINVKFAWKMNDGTYAISSLPIEKVRIRIDEQTTVPTIAFHLGYVGGSSDHLPDFQDLILHSVQYAVITTKEEYWQPQNKLPLVSQ